MTFIVCVQTIMWHLIWNSKRNLKLYCHYVTHARPKAKMQFSQDRFKCVKISQLQSQRTESIKMNGLNTGTSTLKSSVYLHMCYKSIFSIALYFSSYFNTPKILIFKNIRHKKKINMHFTWIHKKCCIFYIYTCFIVQDLHQLKYYSLKSMFLNVFVNVWVFFEGGYVCFVSESFLPYGLWVWIL